MAERDARKELERVAEEIVPVLIDRLAASDLAELEIRDGHTRVRVRRNATSSAAAVAGADPKPEPKRHDRPREGGGRIGTPSGNGEVGPTGVGPGLRASDGGSGSDSTVSEPRRVVARSPAVGYFIARERLATGERVNLDDVLGQIDVLGVRQEVLAPASGIVSRMSAESGQAVEYGEELLQIDLVPRR